MKAVSILSNFRGVTYTEQCLPGKGLGRSPSVKKSGGKKSRWIVPFMYLPLYIAQQQMVWNSASRTCIFFPWPEKKKTVPMILFSDYRYRCVPTAYRGWGSSKFRYFVANCIPRPTSLHTQVVPFLILLLYLSILEGFFSPTIPSFFLHCHNSSEIFKPAL
jgi:hypothetical protein